MMPMLRRLALVLLLFLAPACATSQLWSWGMSGEPEGAYWERESSTLGEIGRGATTLLLLLPALAWDVITFPFQYFGDSPPYGP